MAGRNDHHCRRCIEGLISVLLLWGNRSLPVKWSSHSSAARPVVERARGWVLRSNNLSHRDICERIGRRAFRLCVRTYCSVTLALHPLATTNRNVDHCVWAHRTRLFGLETSTRTRLEHALAVCRRGGSWCSNRRKHFNMGKSDPSTSRYWDFPNPLQSVCALSTRDEPGHSWRASCGRRSWIS